MQKCKLSAPNTDESKIHFYLNHLMFHYPDQAKLHLSVNRPIRAEPGVQLCLAVKLIRHIIILFHFPKTYTVGKPSSCGDRMCAKSKEPSEPEPKETDMSMDPKSIEGFVSDYLTAYREYLSVKDMDERHLPQFYKDFPFTVEIYALPNRAVCALFKKSNRSKFSVQDDDFENVMARTRQQDYDFLQTFPPFTNFETAEAERLAQIDAERDLKASRRLELLGAAEAHIDSIHDDVKSMVELNPWLDEQSEAQKEKLDHARELINELYREVDIDREERFADYFHQLTELMAFERNDIEEVASEFQIHLEEALEEMVKRLSVMEDAIARQDPQAVSSLEDGMADLTKSVREVNLKIKGLDGGVNDELDMELSKVQRQVKDSAKVIAGLKKEIKGMKSDLVLSKEIKETVFRDSKRAHNLNERTTELEREVKDLRKIITKGGSSEIKALEGKMNVLEKRLKDYSRDYTNRTVRKEIAKIPLPDPEPEVTTVTETIPLGNGTVKRTTKKTTKKTTVRKK